jgi:hypothetical protein
MTQSRHFTPWFHVAPITAVAGAITRAGRGGHDADDARGFACRIGTALMRWHRPTTFRTTK